MKKMDRLVFRSYIMPFIAAFGVVLFILVLQFLAKYVDDIFGKGLESIVIAKVFLFACTTLVTLSLPLAILQSSLMLMGNMGEHYELAALKSSGASILKVMRPLLVFVGVVTIGALAFSFYVVPIANLKLYTLLYDLGKVKPSFALKEGHFYSDIDGFVIHVGRINREKDMLYKIKIYDHQEHLGNRVITLADSGKMAPSPGERYLRMTLYQGVSHNQVPKEAGKEDKSQYQRYYFDTLVYQIPLSGFDLERSNESTFAPHHYMKDIHELSVAADSIGSRVDSIRKDMSKYMSKLVHTEPDTVVVDSNRVVVSQAIVASDSLIDVDIGQDVSQWFHEDYQVDIVNKALHNSRAIKNYATIVADRIDKEEERKRKFQIEYHHRWALPLSCIVFLFLGAPLGAIIRKGGLGLPIVFSVIFFILFYVLMIQGRKLARDEIMPVWLGVWLPVLVMSPMAVLFTYQSATDSKILSKEAWTRLIFFLGMGFSAVNGSLVYKKITGKKLYGRKKKEVEVKYDPRTEAIQELLADIRRQQAEGTWNPQVVEIKQPPPSNGEASGRVNGHQNVSIPKKQTDPDPDHS